MENGISTEFVTFNGLVLSGYNKTGKQTEHYYYGSSLLAVEYANNTYTDLYYYLTNSHGDIIGLTDTYGTLTETYRYDAFGTLTSIQSMNENGVLAEAETALSRFLYAGEQYDTVTGLYYLRARQYDTVIGRFTQEDTYLGDGRNLYVYVRNNPLKYVDPSGHCKDLGVDPWDRMNAPYIEMSETALELYDSVLEAQRRKEQAAKEKAWLEALNAGFTAPDSPAGMFGRYWGERIAPTVYDDPSGSGADYAKGVLSFVPEDTWNYLGWEIKYPDLYLTGKMTTSFGVMTYTDWVFNYSELSGMFDMPDIDDTSGSQLEMDLQFFAQKKDIKMVNDVANEIGVDRTLFGEFIHEIKADMNMKANENFTYQELLELARELLEMLK